MSEPPDGFNPPVFSGQTKTMFYNEGNPAALLIINKAGKRVQSTMDFPKAEAALNWCRQHACTLVYMPVDLAKN
jgi:hypothetical protein